MRLYLADTYRGQDAPITALTALHNRIFISGLEDGSLFTYSLDDMIPSLIMHGHRGAVRALAAFRDSDFIVSASADQSLRLWNAETGECTRTLAGHEGAVTAVALADEGRVIVSGSADGTVRLWDTLTGEQCGVCAGHPSAVSWLLPLAGDPHVLVGLADNGTPQPIYVWNYRSGQPVRQFAEPYRTDSVAVLTEDGQLLTGSAPGEMLRWDLPPGCVAQRWPLPAGSALLALFPHGRYAVLLADGAQLVVWDFMQEEVVASAELSLSSPVQAFVTPDSRRVLIGSADGLLCVYRFSSG